jgi:hypothetical protein
VQRHLLSLTRNLIQYPRHIVRLHAYSLFQSSIDIFLQHSGGHLRTLICRMRSDILLAVTLKVCLDSRRLDDDKVDAPFLAHLLGKRFCPSFDGVFRRMVERVTWESADAGYGR